MSDPGQVHAFAPGLIELIARGDDAVARSLRELESGAKLLRDRYADPFEFKDQRYLWASDDPTDVIRSTLLLFRHLHGLRLAEYLEEIIGAINCRSQFRAAFMARAIVELAASAVYWEAKLRAQFERGIMGAVQIEELGDTLDKMVNGGRFQWSVWGKGFTEQDALIAQFAKGNSPEPPNKQVNIVTMIPKLDTTVAATGAMKPGAVRLLYALLSDLCHPNLGANLLLVDKGEQAKGVFVVSGEATDRSLVWFCNNALVPPIEILSKALDRTLRSIQSMALECRKDDSGAIVTTLIDVWGAGKPRP